MPADTTPDPEAPADDAAEEAAPTNRAERRARGKGKGQAQSQPSFRGKSVGAHGPAHTHRMWSNRRSGG
jgi:hypothetical protein